MNTLVIALMALSAPLVFCYDEVYDKIDVDKIIADDNLFTSYIQCMLDKGPCDVEHSADFKKLLPEVISTSCAKCSPIQKQLVRKTVLALREKKPAEFVQFIEKYDPIGEYKIPFTTFVMELLPEVISTSCAKCSPIQKQHVRKTVKALSEKKPDEFVQFTEKYDPKGEYKIPFTAFMTGTD